MRRSIAAVACAAACLASCAPRRRMARRAHLAAAPAMVNPAVSGAVDPAMAVGLDGTKYTLRSFGAGGACFHLEQHLSGAAAQQLSWTLLALRTADDDETIAPAQQGRSRLLDTKVEMVPVDKVVTDTVRDAQGRVVSTTDRHVQTMEPRETSFVEVCFAAPTVIGPDAQYLVLKSTDPLQWGQARYGVWRLVAR